MKRERSVRRIAGDARVARFCGIQGSTRLAVGRRTGVDWLREVPQLGRGNIDTVPRQLVDAVVAARDS